MSRLSVEDEDLICSLCSSDDITCLSMLKQCTIDSLKKQHVITMQDLMPHARFALMTLLGIEEDQRELLLDITEQLKLSDIAHEDLHG